MDKCSKLTRDGIVPGNWWNALLYKAVLKSPSISEIAPLVPLDVIFK